MLARDLPYRTSVYPQKPQSAVGVGRTCVFLLKTPVVFNQFIQSDRREAVDIHARVEHTRVGADQRPEPGGGAVVDVVPG